MAIRNKLLIIVFGISLLCFIVGLVIGNDDLSAINGYPLTVTLLSGFNLLLKNGTFKNTTLYKMVSLGIAVTIVGAMFKIMHWLGADLIMVIGVYSIVIIYFIHFLKKPAKRFVDFGKLLVLFLVLSAKLIKSLHFAYSWELLYLTNFLFILFIMFYVMTEIKAGRLWLNE